eukprot:TRINITY_DN7569_c0_g1_i1.p1 TRINITY_DN7569_c0_g1~~TRINITY_DN7569_c0_g1_i1.p1  ORF type:complete len:107 (-),score=10.27 TRINITY_DN7569_c0_g1_i1:55-375(-)
MSRMDGSVLHGSTLAVTIESSDSLIGLDSSMIIFSKCSRCFLFLDSRLLRTFSSQEAKTLGFDWLWEKMRQSSASFDCVRKRSSSCRKAEGSLSGQDQCRTRDKLG